MKVLPSLPCLARSNTLYQKQVVQNSPKSTELGLKAKTTPEAASFFSNLFTKWNAASTPTKVVSAGLLGLATLFTGYLGYKALNFVYKPIKL